MKVFRTPILLITFSLIFLSCSRDNDPDHFISADKTSLLVGPGGGSDSIIIHSNIDWTIAGLPGWIHTNIASGKAGDSKLVFTVDENKEVQPRTIDIAISGVGVAPVTVKITQSGTQAFLLVDKISFSVSPSGQKDSIVVTSNVDWVITIPVASSWISADKLSGSAGIAKVYFTSLKNSEIQQRSSDITVSSSAPGIQSVKLAFSQKNLGITDFSPKRGPWKTSVTMTGNFGANPVVKLNNVTCNVTSSSSTQIVFSTAKNGISGKISISFDSTVLVTGTDFTVTNTWVKILDKGYSGLGGVIQDGVKFSWNNKIYFGFGLDRDGNNATINTFGFRIYDPVANQWSQGPSQPSNMGGRTNPGCVLANNVAYIGLGRYYGPYSDYWSFNPASGVWNQLPDFPAQGIYPLNFENQNSLYVGVPTYTYDTAVIRKYDPLANNGSGSWLQVPTEFPRLQGALCFTIGSYTYIVGGFNSSTPRLSSTYKFDPVNNSLTRGTDVSRSGIDETIASSFVLNGKGYIVDFYGDMYQYDPASDTWTTLTPTFPPYDAYNRVALANSEIYAWYEDGAVYKYIPL